MAANTNFAVAVHAMSVLACSEGLTTSAYLASSINTNAVVVRRIMQRLAAAELVRSVPGKNGGFELARPAKKIRLIEILRGVDSAAVFRIHDNAENPVCSISCNMKGALADVMERVDAAVARELSKTSLADLVETVR